ncbi:hypothetical protein [Paraburkholderia flava]|uniref:hypothetical protein n=1 Tax=Paraburkholderia flava TaxID=2547393 RepID=UPI001F0D1F43|nr:hypothetical protein [Paraburkholderia flava]
MFNYHLYNAYAFLNGKLHTDLAPAGIQTYFNPVLDVVYFAANATLPAPLVGFLLGFVHGLNFVAILSIARSSLPELPEEDRLRVPLLLALAGVLTANFLSGLGNSMGDDTTALFTLSSLALLLKRWQELGSRSWRSIAILFAAGLLGGFAVGLKLTNVVYGAALCVALLFYPGTLIHRIRLGFVYGIGITMGLALTSGYWIWTMWHTFGNPLFPQFSSLFPNPLTPPVGISDQSWLPRSAMEWIFWPFVFSLDSKRVGQATLHQMIWPVVYMAFFAWVLIGAWRRVTKRHIASMPKQAGLVVAFVALGYLLWMRVFSIYRYIVPIETLAPLVLYVLLTAMMSYTRARRLSVCILSACTLLVVAGGVQTWGHEKWARQAFRADTPHLDEPSKTTGILVGGDPPWGWLTTFFPSTVAFAQIEANFPDTPSFEARLHEIVRQRGGPTFAILDGKYNWRIDNVASMNRIVDVLGLTSMKSGCDAIERTVDRLHLHASVVRPTAPVDGRYCRLDLRADDVKDTTAGNRQAVEAATPLLSKHGFDIDPQSCKLYFAHIGQGTFPYQWCRLHPR